MNPTECTLNAVATHAIMVNVLVNEQIINSIFVIGFVLRFKSFKKSFFVELPYLTSFLTELVQPHLVQGDYVQKVQNL